MSPRQRFDRVMVHVDIAHHLKLRRLTDAEFKAFLVGILPIAAKSDVRGALMIGHHSASADDVAHQARVTTRVANGALGKLRDVGMLEHDDELGADWVHDFDEWNPEPRTDSTAAERAARYRAKQKAKRDRHDGVTTSSRRDARNGHGNVTPTEVEEEVTPPTSSVTPSVVGSSRPDAEKEREKAGEDGQRLCRLLADLIRQRDSKAKVAPDSARWLRDMRLLLADRDGDDAEIERVLRWSQADAFWQANILSPGKLREKFTALRQRMAGTAPAEPAPSLSGAQLAARTEERERRLQAERAALAARQRTAP